MKSISVSDCMTLTPLCAGVWSTYVKMHSVDLRFRGLFKKFIPRTSDFADFLKNSFHGPRISWTFVKIHSADLRFRGLFEKFIPRTLDFLDFCKNSFRGPRILRTFVKIHSADLGFCGLYQIHLADL